MSHLVELIVCLCQIFIFLGALGVLTEVSISIAKGPCEAWPLDTNTSTCPFQSYGTICGLMNDIRVDGNSKFYFYGGNSACNACITIAAVTVILCIVLFVIQLGVLFTKLGYMQDDSLFTLHTTTMMSGIVWLCCLVLIAANTGGYVGLCQALSKPACNNSAEYNAFLSNCYVSTNKLYSCSQFGPESFAGRLAVALGLSWVAFVAASVAIAALAYYQWNLQQFMKEQKVPYGAEANQKALDAHYTYLDRMESASHVSPSQSRPYIYNADHPNSDEVSQPYPGNSSLSYRPLPTLPSTDRVEDVMLVPVDARTRPSKNKTKRMDLQRDVSDIEDDLKESSF